MILQLQFKLRLLRFDFQLLFKLITASLLLAVQFQRSFKLSTLGDAELFNLCRRHSAKTEQQATQQSAGNPDMEQGEEWRSVRVDRQVTHQQILL
jgi:hypothetical protein